MSVSLRPLRQLPEWLRAAADRRLLTEALAQASPTSPRGLSPPGCRSARIRLREDGWRARYGLVFRDRAGVETVVHVAGVLTEPVSGPSAPVASGDVAAGTWRCRLPGLGLDLGIEQGDPALPILDDLTDARRARQLLERAVNEGNAAHEGGAASAHLHIRACEPQVMRYKPGSRCTVRYRVEAAWSDDRPAPRFLVAKTYRGDKGLIAFRGMQALWSSPLADSPVVGIAQPLGFLPGERLLVQGPVDEDTTLKAEVEDAAVHDDPHRWERVGSLVEQAADGLAELHGCGVVPRGEHRWPMEIDEADALVARMAGAVPSAAPSASRATVASPDVPALAAAAATARMILRTIDSWARNAPADRDVPAHGSFRPAQVLVAGTGISFIDFDGFCTAEPAMDVALFCASVKTAGMNALTRSEPTASTLTRPMSELTAVADRFVARYASRRAVNLDRIAAWEGVYLLTQLLHGWTKVKQDRIDASVPLLRAHLERMCL